MRHSTPTVELVARAWHAFSDHALEGVPLDGNGCKCRYYAPLAKQVVGLFTGEPVFEPGGLGAVAVNPLTDQVYVRVGHPALPWQDPSVEVIGDWADPTGGNWFTWADLPRPLVIQSTGWPPPPTLKNTAMADLHAQPEPTGIGAVAEDGDGLTWVRAGTPAKPWLRVDGDSGSLHSADWVDLAQPVKCRSLGWARV